MNNNTEIISRPKIKILENAYNEVVNTIGSRPAESGGLLFGNEDDMIIQKFVFDKNANTTKSSYTFNTEFLNPEIKRLWNEENLSCIGFIHSHPHGYSHLSSPDIEYFSSMFECMPRKHYITPVVFTVPDGGFKLNAHILPNQSKETIKTDIEVLPDDYFRYTSNIIEKKSPESPKINFHQGLSEQQKYNATIKKIWGVWRMILAFGLSWYLFKTLQILTNYLNYIMP